MSDPELVGEVSRWLRYAREDLAVAEMIVEHEKALRAACFHAQQCAEKAIRINAESARGQSIRHGHLPMAAPAFARSPWRL
jgi:HEPN domain-containing protein